MTIDRGGYIYSNGGQDKRDVYRCQDCHQRRPCYRGPQMGTIMLDDERVPIYRWVCEPCFQLWVDTALSAME